VQKMVLPSMAMMAAVAKAAEGVEAVQKMVLPSMAMMAAVAERVEAVQKMVLPSMALVDAVKKSPVMLMAEAGQAALRTMLPSSLTSTIAAMQQIAASRYLLHETSTVRD
jgi:hypothetical protein